MACSAMTTVAPGGTGLSVPFPGKAWNDVAHSPARLVPPRRCLAAGPRGRFDGIVEPVPDDLAVEIDRRVRVVAQIDVVLVGVVD